MLIRSIHTKHLRHFFMKKADADTVWLHPFSVNHKLRNGPFSDVCDYFLCCAGSVLNINFGMGDAMPDQKALGLATVPAPSGRIKKQSHAFMVNEGRLLPSQCIGRRRTV